MKRSEKRDMNDGILTIFCVYTFHLECYHTVNTKVGIFPPSYVVVLPFISCFTTFIAWIPTPFLN